MRSPVYWHPLLYRMVMRLLYGKHFSIRYQTIAELVPGNAHVVELCMGDGYLYSQYLSKKNITYLGLDINVGFVSAAQRKNINAKIHCAPLDDIPNAEYIILQGSLYQFIPNAEQLVQKMIEKASVAVLISEPVLNRADSKNKLVSFIAKRAVNAGKGAQKDRFNETALLALFKKFKEFREEETQVKAKEMIGVFRK